MAQNLTAGFDLLVQVSEAELNRQTAARFASGALPAAIVAPFNEAGASGELTLNFATPAVDLDTATPRGLRVTYPFANSALAITAPIAVTFAPLAGTVLIVDSMAVAATGGTSAVIMDFADGIAQVEVTFTPDSLAVLQPLMAATGLDEAQLRTLFADRVRTFLRDQLRTLALTPPIPTNPANDNPMLVTSFDVGTVNDPGALDRDALVIGVRTTTETGGNIANVVQSSIPAGAAATILLGNNWLLFRTIRPALAGGLGVSATLFNAPCDLTTPITLSDGVRLTQLRAFIEGNRIHVTGFARKDGTGFSAHGPFDFFIDLAIAGGTITATPTTPTTDIDIDIEWWVYLLGVITGGVLLGAIGMAVGLVAVLIADVVADVVADSIAASAIAGSGVLAPVAFPLGFGAGLTIDTVVLDDLQLAGEVVPLVEMPVRSTGSVLLPLGTCIDLDSGAISPAGLAARTPDLCWGSGSTGIGLSAQNNAALASFARSYGAITHPELESLPYGTAAIPSGQFPVWVPPATGSMRRFAVRTTEGRYAKCQAHTDPSLTLHLTYVAYDRPMPALDIAGRWERHQEGEVEWAGESTTRSTTLANTPGADLGGVRVAGGWALPGVWSRGRFGMRPLAWRGYFQARPRLLAYPIDFQWCINGQVLMPGDGEVNVHGKIAAYHVDRDRLVLTTGLGDRFAAEICVSGIDAFQRELFTCVSTERSGTENVSDEVIRDPERLQEVLEVLDRVAATGLGGPGIGPTPGPGPDPYRGGAEALAEAIDRTMR
jgi:hypothetical protein